MPTHTPATALAAVLNELWMLSQDADRSAESWRTEVQKLIDQARPASNLFLDREGQKPDIVQDAGIAHTFESQLVEEGQATAYVFENGEFREIRVTHDNGGPLTDEEVAIMMREGWGEDSGGC